MGRVAWHPFRFPVGIEYLRQLPCEPNDELTRDDAWLPATHVGGPSRGPTDSGGIWLYYARGCSDLLWHMGRTALARNRAHAAVRAEQMTAALAAGVANSTLRAAALGLESLPRGAPAAAVSLAARGIRCSS